MVIKSMTTTTTTTTSITTTATVMMTTKKNHDNNNNNNCRQEEDQQQPPARLEPAKQPTRLLLCEHNNNKKECNSDHYPAENVDECNSNNNSSNNKSNNTIDPLGMLLLQSAASTATTTTNEATATAAADTTRRINSIVWNASVHDSVHLEHCALIHENNKSNCNCNKSNAMIVVGANSTVQYCQFQILESTMEGNVSYNDDNTTHTSTTPIVRIGLNCFVSDYSLVLRHCCDNDKSEYERESESLIVPDNMIVQRITSPSSLDAAAAPTTTSSSCVFCFDQDDFLLVLGRHDVQENTIFGKSCQVFATLMGLAATDLWDANDSDHSVSTALLFPVVDRCETYQEYYAWLEPFCTTTTTTTLDVLDTSTWTTRQVESLKRYKSAVRLSLVDLQDCCETALRAGMTASRQRLLHHVLPTLQEQLYKNLFQSSQLLLQPCLSSSESAAAAAPAVVSMVVNHYMSTLAWIQQQQQKQQQGQGRSKKSQSTAAAAAAATRTASADRRRRHYYHDDNDNGRRAVKDHVVTPLRYLDNIIRMTSPPYDETIAEMAVQYQVALLKSLAKAVSTRTTTTCHYNNDKKKYDDCNRVARRVQIMISACIHDRERFTAVRDFVLLEYMKPSHDTCCCCKEVLELLAMASYQSRPMRLQRHGTNHNHNNNTIATTTLLLQQQQQQQPVYSLVPVYLQSAWMPTNPTLPVAATDLVNDEKLNYPNMDDHQLMQQLLLHPQGQDPVHDKKKSNNNNNNMPSLEDPVSRTIRALSSMGNAAGSNNNSNICVMAMPTTTTAAAGSDYSSSTNTTTTTNTPLSAWSLGTTTTTSSANTGKTSRLYSTCHESSSDSSDTLLNLATASLRCQR